MSTESTVNAGQGQVDVPGAGYGRVRMNEAQLEELCNMIISSDMPEETQNDLVMRLRSGDASVVQDIMAAAHGYPSVPIVYGAEVKFKLGVIAAIKRFKKKKTHNRTTMDRLAAMRELARDLSMVYGMESHVKVAAVCLIEEDDADSRRSFYHARTKTIVMVEKLSIITFLHEFAHALGKDEVGAVRWSLTLFKRVWPQQFERLQPDGHTLINPQDEAEEPLVGTNATVEVMSETDAEEAEALALMDESVDETEEDQGDEDEWLDDEFDDEDEEVDDENEEVEDEEPPPPPRKRLKKKPAPKKKVGKKKKTA